MQAVFSPALIAKLARAYATLDRSTLAASALLNGRHEYLLPFQPPFNEEWLLRDPLLFHVASAYLGEPTLDALTVILAQAPIGGQVLHRDIHEGPGAALSLQIPLVDIPPDHGGALALQPGTHTTDGHDCDEEAGSLPVGLAAGSVLLYDARACHAGTANERVLGGRPIMYMLLKRRSTRRTGYEPFELRLRFGEGGLADVAHYRTAFERSSHCGTNRSDEVLAGDLAAAHSAVPPLVNGRPWYLR